MTETELLRKYYYQCRHTESAPDFDSLSDEQKNIISKGQGFAAYKAEIAMENLKIELRKMITRIFKL